MCWCLHYDVHERHYYTCVQTLAFGWVVGGGLYVCPACAVKGVQVETLWTLQTVARLGDWMTALDLSDGYYHFRIRPEDARYFQISTPTGAYTIDALNMGWTRSPEVFTDASPVAP